MSYKGLYPLRVYATNYGFPLGIVPIPVGRQCPRSFHDHDSTELAIITEGHGLHILSDNTTDKTIPVSAGDVLLIHPGAVHGYDNCTTMGLVNILYDSRRLPFPILDGDTMPFFRLFFPRERQSFHCSAEPLLHLNTEALPIIVSMVKKITEELFSGRPGSQLSSIAKFIEILVVLSRTSTELLRPKSDEHTAICRAIEYLNESFASPINLNDLAKKSCISRRNFDRLFKHTTGQTPLDYLIRRRLMVAVSLLQTTTQSIASIAKQCGFSSSNYFCRKFRISFQISPRQYQRHHPDQDGSNCEEIHFSRRHQTSQSG